VKRSMAMVLVSVMVACGDGGPTAPQVVTEAPRAVVAPGNSVGTPTVVQPPAEGSVWSLRGAKGILYVAYSGDVRAEIETHWTTFDGQGSPQDRWRLFIEPHSELAVSFPKTTCFQGDAEQVGVKPIGGVFFDRNGDPFNPSLQPEKVVECGVRPTPQPTPEPTPKPTPPPPPDPECPLPEVDVLTWQGKGNPETECAAFGRYVPTDGPAAFYICKAGNDREVWLSEPTGETCRNGKGISHVTACSCY
jgi:hypothetical protein